MSPASVRVASPGLILREESVQLGVCLVRGFFGEIVAAIERSPGYVIGPIAPDCQDIVPFVQFATSCPECKHRTRYSLLSSIFLIERKIYGDSRPVVLTHGVDRLGVVDSAQIILEGFRVDIFWLLKPEGWITP